MKKKILVLGACGFLGSNFIRAAYHSKTEYNLVGCDRITYKNSLQTRYENSRYNFYLGDCKDLHFMKVLLELEKPDIIIFAIKNQICDNLFNLLQQNYSHIKNIFLIPKCEMQSYHCYEFEDFSKLNYKIAILPSIIGNRQNNAENNLQFSPSVAGIVYSVMNNERYKLFSNGNKKREWFTVDDFYSAIIFLLSREEKEINFISNYIYSDIEIFKIVSDFYGIKNSNFIDLIEKEAYVPGEVYSHIKTSNELGWKANSVCKQDFANYIHQTLQWYLNNKWFMKDFGKKYE